MDVTKTERILGRRTAMGGYIPEPGQRPLTILAEAVPGPADYSPDTRLTKPSAPKYSVQGRRDTPLLKSDELSPADFDTASDLVWKTKTIYIKPKGETQPYDVRRKGHLTAGVGAGLYKVENLATGSQGPRCVLGTRYKDAVQTGPPNVLVQPVDTPGVTTPGPTYKPRSERGNAKSIGLPAKEASADGPGPADYDTLDWERQGPAHSIAARLPMVGYRKQPIIPDNPGPKYDLGTTIGQCPAVTIKGRHHTRTRDFVPGPDQYTLPDTVGHGPTAVLTYRPFEVDQGPHPGPADYTVKDANLKKSPTHVFGNRTKPTYPDALHYPATGYQNPSPCDYNTARQKDGPKYSIGRRINGNQKDDNPAPNRYEVKDPPNTRKAPEFTIGRKYKRTDGENIGPGPAAYLPKLPQSDKRGFSIVRKPSKSVGESTPAANAYSIKQNLTNKGPAAGPMFSLRSRHSPFVYSGFRNLNMIRG